MKKRVLGLKKERNKNLDILAYVINGVIAIIAGLITYLVYERYQSRVYVKRIIRASDPDFEGFVDVYEQVFSDSVRVSVKELADAIEEDRLTKGKAKKSALIRYLLICKVSKQVVGFLMAQYDNQSKYAFIAYLGINKQNFVARQIATRKMILEFVKILGKKHPACKGVVFEIEPPTNDLPKVEKLTRLARARLFRTLTSMQGLHLRVVDFDYLQPEMPVDFSEEEEQHLWLCYIALQKSVTSNTITKKELLTILKFIYDKIYGTDYRDDNIKQELYRAKLKQQLLEIESSLPDTIKLRSN